MAEPAPKADDDTPTVEIDANDQARFNAMLSAALPGALKKALEENAPPREKTGGRPGGITELLFGSGGR